MNKKSKLIRIHNTHLKAKGLYENRLSLRPLTESDWDILLKWNQDPEVLYYSEGERVNPRSLEKVKSIYRLTSQTAYCFIIELDSTPIGECWLEKMNFEKVLKKYPNKDCRRIDLMIGEKKYWNRGIGTEVIRTLVEFGFEKDCADIIFGMVYSHNERSRHVFEKVGFQETDRFRQKAGSKAEYQYELSLSKEKYFKLL
jgi:aminoglycoside 6'-N-acetyltransferase